MNICYLILNILFLFIVRCYLNMKKVNFKYRLILLGIYLIFTFLTFSYMNGVINHIFKLKFLDVKAYLLLLIITNVIVLFTLNRPTKIGYKIPNYLLFIFLTIILGTILSIVLGNRYSNFYMMDISNAVNFIDLSFVIFILYLIIISLVYLGYHIFSGEIDLKKELNVSKKNFKKVKIPKVHLKKIKVPHIKLPIRKKKKQNYILTAEELLNYHTKDEFYINGVNASIIFEDSNKENIVKNYYILNKDIHAKLMNGYTLEENIMLKNICMKLQVGNLKNIDIHNVSILNKISVDEYNLLKKIYGIN